MGQLHKSAATLGFYGDDLDPDEITTLLGEAPSVGVTRGGTWVTSRGAHKVAPTGTWRIGVELSEPEDLSWQIKGLLAQLTSDIGVWRDLTRRYRGVIFCGLWLKSGNDGLQLSTEVLGSLAERGLLLDLNIYANDDGD